MTKAAFEKIERGLKEALRDYGDKLLNEEQRRGILPDEQRLLDTLK